MPVLRLLGPVRWVEASGKFGNFLLELDNKAYLGGNAEVTDDVEADSLEECVPTNLLLIASVHRQVVSLDRSDLHYVADIQRVYPL
jgi:hypothetical protein